MSSATCIICLVAFSEELEVVSLKCRHCFHRNCIRDWLKVRQDCPQCRKVVHHRQMYRVILSFDTNYETNEDQARNDFDRVLFESQKERIIHLENQLKKVTKENEGLQKLLSNTKLHTEIKIVRQKVNYTILKEYIINISRQEINELRQNEQIQAEEIESLTDELTKARSVEEKLRTTLNQIQKLIVDASESEDAITFFENFVDSD
uniref:CSON009720 protein n=1 Tax=Culicoides sonorensis TaxID=179676 RepID=A0A336K0U8_CULSO